MSGGSLDYCYRWVLEVADLIRQRSRDPRHLALAKHLDKVSKALHDIELTFSCDSAEGSEMGAIEAVVSKQEILSTVLDEAREISKYLNHLLSDPQ